jgi:hypothetical protein
LEKENYFSQNDRELRRGTWNEGYRAYTAELARISKDGTRARKLLKQAVELPFDAAALLDSCQRAFSGRLEFVAKGDKLAVSYTAGQYFPTEYRPAAASVLESYIRAVTPKVPPSPSDQFFTVSDMAAANERAGHYWFSKGTKKFFSSRFLPELFKGERLIWFISSEQKGFDRNSGRAFSVRVFDTQTANVNTVGEFNGYSSAGDARAVARELVKADKRGEHVRPEGNARCAFCGSYGEYCSAAVVNG